MLKPVIAGELTADFEKRFPEGAVIQAALERLADAFSITVLFGPSGCGKTTILRCLAGLEWPNRGQIRLGEQVWFDAASGVFRTPQERGIGYLFQEYALFPHLTVAQNIAYGLGGLSRAERQRRVAELLDLLHLTGFERRRPQQLSGGQQQRVALARAVARRPRLLLLDEPLSALDAAAREQLRRELRRLLAEFGIPAIIVTHDSTEAIALADHVIVLDQGRIRQSGPVQEVFSRPVDPTVARIVGVETVVPGKVIQAEEGLATVAIGPRQLVSLSPEPVGSEVFVCIRAEEVTLQRETAGLSSARNRLQGTIRALSPEGPMIRIELDCGFPLAALVTRPACGELGLREGETVTALVKAPAVHLVARG